MRQKVSRLRLRIVGGSPTDDVKALAADDVAVIGFAPETTRYLLSSDISIAPIRYGGGIKGKIGEAQAHGLPVVTTSIGAEGFGFQVGRDVLVGDTPQAFADAIASLWLDWDLYERIRTNGWQYISERYSLPAVERLLAGILERITIIRVMRVSPLERMKIIAHYYFYNYFLWRFRA